MTVVFYCNTPHCDNKLGEIIAMDQSDFIYWQCSCCGAKYGIEIYIIKEVKKE